MKLFSIQNRQTLTHHSIQASRLLALLILLLPLGLNTARATDYVLTYTNNGTTYFLSRNGTTGVTRVSTFDPTTCIWSCETSNGSAGTLNNSTTYSWLYQAVNNQKYYLSAGSSSLSLVQNPSKTTGDNSKNYTCWRTDGNYVYNFYQYKSNGKNKTTTYYIKLSDNTPSCTTSSGGSCAKPYAVTMNEASDFTFSVSSPAANAVIGQIRGTMDLSASATGTYRPAYYSFNNKYYYSTDGGATYTPSTSQPGTSTFSISYELLGNAANYVSLSGNTITYTTDPGQDLEISVKITAIPQDYSNAAKSETRTITLYSSTIAAPTFTRSGNLVSLSTTSLNATIYYTIDGTTPSASSTPYTSAIDLTTQNLPVTIKAIAIRNDNSSSVTSQTYSQLACARPTISIVSTGAVTITAESGTTIYYTTNGDDPTTTETSTNKKYTAPFNVSNETTVKAIAVKSGYDNSSVVSRTFITSGVTSDGKVILNDYEDHNWAYYAGLDYTFPDGNTQYNEKYKYSIYSPDPRNVKITYRGYNTQNSTIILNGTAVNTNTLNNNTTPHVSPVSSEGQNTFVYYETLEKFVIGYFTQHQTNGDYDGTPANPDNTSEQYPYTVISNPFSVRPSQGSGTSKIYYGFAGWKIISGGTYIQDHSDNDILALDELIHFTNLDNNYTPNCTSAEIVLEATWAEAEVKTGTSAQSFTGGTYETNFIVASGDITTQISQSSPCTIIGMYPDGTSDNSASRTIKGLKVTTTRTTDPYDRSNCVKVEWIRHGDGTFDANGRNMTMGRGIISSSNSGNTAQGNVYNCASDNNCVNTVKIESGYYSSCKPINSSISQGNLLDAYIIFGCDYDRALADYTNSSNTYNSKLQIKSSGLSWSGLSSINRSSGELYVRTLFKSGMFNGEYYAHRAESKGQRFITIEGGHFGDIRGGSEVNEQQPFARAFTLRGKGNFIVDEQIAGGSTSRNCQGNRCIVLTGGSVIGWIAAGSNSNNSSGGVTTGESFVYVGGNAQVNSNGSQDLLNTSSGGVVYGAGCGISSSSNSGQMTRGSNLVLADNAYVERGIYGGGAMGRLPEGQTANMFVLGGHIGRGTGKIKDNTTELPVLQSGVFGGACNVGGGYSNIYMNGGLVEGGVFGGSNISGTMENSVNIQIVGGQVGTESISANVHGGGFGENTEVAGNVDVTIGKTVGEKGPDVFGNVFGGAALGTVTGSSTVTVNAGTCTGAIYGGGLGEQGNNTRGVVSGGITVTVNGTDPKPAGRDYAIEAVFGGGSYAPANCVPDVTVYNCDNSIGEVYGGGNAATVLGTAVTVYGANKIGSVFGGCNQANVTEAGTSVVIYGGIIDNVFGGNNHSGSIIGPVQVAVDAVSADENDPCQMEIGNVYGGGNEASYTDVDDDGDYPIVRIQNGSILHDVFGGGLGETARVTGNPQVEMTGGLVGGTLYGGGSAAPVTGNPHVKMNVSGHSGTGEAKSDTWWDVKGYVFGGGLGASAKVTGSTKVEILGTSRVGKNVYGGGNGGAVTGNTDVIIGGE